MKKTTKKTTEKEKIETEFGRGLVIPLILFSEHIANKLWKTIDYLDFFYNELKGDKKKAGIYDRNMSEAIEYAERIIPYETPEKIISYAITLWASGAKDHLIEIECPEEWKKTKIEKKIKELKDLVSAMYYSDNNLWTTKDLDRVEDLACEIGYLIDKQLKLNPDKGRIH